MTDQAQRPIRVQVPGHGIVEFPAGTPEAEMREALMTLDAPQADAQPTAPREPGLAERFLGFFGMQPSEKFEQYRDVLNSGGSLDDVIKRAEASEQRNGGVFRKADREAMPYVGGTVGGVMGGAPGAAFGGAAGEAVRQLDNRLAGDAAPSTPMDAAKGIATQGAVQGALEGVGNLATQGVAKAGAAVYRGYLKPSLAAKSRDKAKQIVATALRESLPISEKGTTKAQDLINNINHQVKAELANNPNVPVDLHRIAEKVRAFAQRKYGGAGAPRENFEAAMKVADEIDKHWSLGLPPGVNPTRVDVSLTEANEVKRRLDTAIGDNFGVESKAATEARKVGRHASRKAIERGAPAVKSLNQREAEVIDALDALKGGVGRENNKNPIEGWRTMAVLGGGSGIGMGAGLDTTTAIIAAVGARVAMSPNIMSRASILASKFAKVPGTDAALAARMALVLALRESEEARDE